jgi:hypothetical protein
VKSLQNRRFRLLLLAVAGLPILAQYGLQTVVAPLANSGFDPGDFNVYLKAAAALTGGRDPYRAFFASTVPDPTLNQAYIYPPLLAWALQPLAALPNHVAVSVGLLAGQLFLSLFLLLAGRAVRLRGLERWAVAVILTIGFYPVRLNLDGAQVNLLLLALSGVWFAGWVGGDRWWSGAALGVGAAIKFLQLPSIALLGWGRRWRALAAATGAFAVCWLVAAPGYLPEYLQRVLPALGGGTGFRENFAPTGTLYRLFVPASFYGPAPAPGMPVRAGAALIALAAVVVTISSLGRPRWDRRGRELEAASVVAASPLVATLAWPSHLVLLLLPILVLVNAAIDWGDVRLLIAALASWALLGVVHTTFLTAIAAGIRWEWLLRPWAESGLAGILVLWAASLYALRVRAAPAPATSREAPRLREPVPG